ncbi:putative transcriptional regulator [Thermanaeromonas toyohensis ToBE]|uniref:Putative transcriptional regulator n=2 Tax=Thermanaeromonas TaxID=202949 RepID=A0A1W1W3E7_9FIRM|nr:putative transcriptional regulator [Thermanaeromonas toyohensis ToBE]
MDFIRVGEKLLDRRKIYSAVERILELRAQGFSQEEVAQKVAVDRTFISRLEKLGEVRRGRRIAVIGFPVANKEELHQMLEEEGVEYIFLLTEAERWDYVRQKNGLQLINEIMEIIARLREYDVVVIIGSDYRIRLSEALLGREVVGVEIGTSPIREDRVVDVERLRGLIRQLTSREKKAAYQS